LYVVFSAIVENEAVPDIALAIVNAMAQRAAAHAAIKYQGGKFRQEFVIEGTALEWLLWPIAKAATDLLLSDELTKVRKCASESCAWIFIDRTKNHRRKWCEMKTCGNRDKARRYYARNKKI
jgi:predicted RNA-binding Zn ribbon-like protein